MNQLEIPIVISGTSCIYALVDPRDHSVRYVGKSDNPRVRYFAHLHGPESNLKTYKANWIRQLKSEGLVPSIVILERVHPSEWADAERKWIAHFRNTGARLTNSTSGGDGFDSEWVRLQWTPKSERALRRVDATRGRKPDPSKRTTTSTYIGVMKSRDGRYRAFRTIEGRRVHLGYYKTEQEAVEARKQADAENRTESITKPKGMRMERIGREGMQGVTKCKNQWRSYFNINGKQTTLGSFETFEEAVASRRSAENGNIVIKPSKKIESRPKKEQRLDAFGSRIGKRNTSGVKGVSFMPSRNRWQAYFRTTNGKTRSLGKFQSFDQAVEARKAAETQYSK